LFPVVHKKLIVIFLQVVRSPDGESRAYSIGQLSIQRAAVWVLEHYYTEFPIYNPYLERLPVSKSRKGGSSFKFYDVDGMNNSSLQVKYILLGTRLIMCTL
jgi:vang-like